MNWFGLLFIIVSGYLFWTFLFRKIYIRIKYGKDKVGIKLPEEYCDNVKLIDFLRNKLYYPNMKSIHLDERGNIEIAGKYGLYTLDIRDGVLFLPTSATTDVLQIEEAETIRRYIRKIFEPNAPINEYKFYKNFKNARRNKIITTSVFVLSLAIFVISVFVSEFSLEGLIKSSYLSQYSTKQTIGEAFDNFFDGGKWASYEEGTTEYVTFQGTCTFLEEKVTVTIIFSVYTEDDGTMRFYIDKVKMNNEEMPAFLSEGLFIAIFSQ